MLEQEILNVLEVFDSCGMTQEQQRGIFIDGGVSYNFASLNPPEENLKINLFEFARFLRICQITRPEIDIKHLLVNLYEPKYSSIVLGLKKSGVL